MLPLMRYKNSKGKYTITAFGGVNQSYSKGINELSKAHNMSSSAYPAISSRRGAAQVRETENTICTAGYFDKLYTVEKSGKESGSVYLCTETSQTQISEFATLESGDKERTMEFIKNEILILPDNIIYHTNTSAVKKGSVSETITPASCQEKYKTQSKTSDIMPKPYDVWYSAYLTGNSIVSVSTTYRVSSGSYNFYAFSVSTDFEIGDIVTVKLNVVPSFAIQNTEYFKYKEKMQNGITLKIKDIVKVTHSTPSGNVTECTSLIFDDNAIDMGGYSEIMLLDVTVEKGIPNFTDICSFENRMWGVTHDQIHASKLGDCSEWNDFTTDAYGTLPSSCFKTGVESDGSFTAITAYNGNVLAFKEDCIYKIYGNEPSEYSLTRINCPGVEDGAKNTLAVVSGTLFYKGKSGIYAYNGSSVTLISRFLSIENHTAGYAAGDDRYYYIELYADDRSCLYVYDTMYGIWHITDVEGQLKALTKTDDGIIMAYEDRIMQMEKGECGDWNFTFGFAKKEFESKHICNVLARYTLGQNASAQISLTNKHGTKLLANLKGQADNKPVEICVPVSCSEDAELSFVGNGEFTLISLCIKYKETGIND